MIAYLLRFLLFVFYPLTSEGWIVPQPKANVWTTLAKALNQSGLCLSMGSAEDPMSTCLVGIPLKANDYPFAGKKPDPVRSWDQWTRILPHAPQEPQELALVGSAKSIYCINFNYRFKGLEWAVNNPHRHQIINVNPHNKTYNIATWCNDTAPTPSESTKEPRQLPKGVFLICGDWAWAGIPFHLRGGPCTLGQLALLTPDKKHLIDWTTPKRAKRALNQMPADCDSEIVSWPYSKRVAVSIFLPWVAAARALGQIEHIECWLGRQANLTSQALAELLSDEETTKQATLQNRAAIDFLLLAHGHGCEDFAGMCCFDLKTHSESIAAKIQQMKQEIKQLKVEPEGWFERLFSGSSMSAYGTSILKTVCNFIFLIFIIFLALTLFKFWLVRLLNKKNGGDRGGVPIP